MVVESNWPRVASSPSGEPAVVVPITDAGGKIQVAIATDVEGTLDGLERMAELWMAASQASEQAEQLRLENAFFAEQLSDDLEELAFLREIVNHLDMSDAANDLLTLAEGTLPLLNQSVKAECTVMLLLPEEGDSRLAVPTLQVGKRSFDDKLVLRVIEKFGAPGTHPAGGAELSGIAAGAQRPAWRAGIHSGSADLAFQSAWLAGDHQPRHHRRSVPVQAPGR